MTALMSLAASAVGILFGYAFPKEPLSYELRIGFDGYLPVLGGIEQKVRLDMEMLVRGKDKDSAGAPQTESSLSAFSLSMLDKQTSKYLPLPLTLENAKAFFPPTTIAHTSLGAIMRTNAPDIALPIRLPGLHTKHIPDVTFLLLQFPDKALEPGNEWSYVRDFGGSDVAYAVTYKGLDGSRHLFELKLRQDFVTFEDENKNALASPEGAEYTVTTRVTGVGKVWFDGTQGTIHRSVVTADAESSAVSAKGQPVTKRKLVTTLEMQRKERKPSLQSPPGAALGPRPRTGEGRIPNSKQKQQCFYE